MNKMRKDLSEHHPDLMVLPKEFDTALVGVVQRAGGLEMACYDAGKVIYLLQTREPKLSHEDAVEHFEFNILGAYVGSHTPCFLNKEF
jgi:hypothetical protein